MLSEFYRLKGLKATNDQMIFFLFFCIPYYQEMPFFGPNLRENYPTRNNKTNSKVIGKVIGLLVNSKLLFEKDFKQFRYRGRR